MIESKPIYCHKCKVWHAPDDACFKVHKPRINKRQRHRKKNVKLGLSYKILGRLGYDRQRRRIHERLGLRKPRAYEMSRYTGLSDKMLGHAEYMRRWRKLKTK